MYWHRAQGQATVAPQASGVGPQVETSQGSGAVHCVVVVVEVVVVVVVVVVSQTWAAVHISSSGQVPQTSMSGHDPSGIMPQAAPCAAQVVGVLHVPNFLPDSLAHTPLCPFVPQQLWFVRQTCPSALHGSAAAERAPTPRAIVAASSSTGAKWNNLCGVRDMATSFGNRAATLGAGLPGTKVGGEGASDGGEVSVRIADLLWEGRPHARTATTAGRLRLSRDSLSLQFAPCDTTLRRLQARRSRRLRAEPTSPSPPPGS